MLSERLFHMGIVEGKKEALWYDVLMEMGMKLFVWFDLVGRVDLLAWFRMLIATIEFIILLT